MKNVFRGALAVSALLVLIPTSGVAQSGTLDHLVCYKMTDPLKITAAINLATELQPEFRQANCAVVKPIRFCVPATKTVLQSSSTGPNIVGQPLRDDYICYLLKCEQGARIPAKLVADQFGQRRQGKYRAAEVCVPARKAAVPCQRIGTGKQCGGACPDDAAGNATACRYDSTTNECTCEPLQCTGKPDSTGQCGGICPTPSEICRPGVDASGKPACLCQPPPPPPCGLNPATGTCGGTCDDPAALCVFVPTATGADCICQPPEPGCARDQAGGQCGGPCPPGLECLLEPAINDCRCITPPLNCGPNPTTGECGGVCPAGSKCQLIATTGVPPACGCGP